LIQQMTQLTQQLAQLTQHVAQLTAVQRYIEQQLSRMRDDLGDIKDICLEKRYRTGAFASFFRFVRHPHVVRQMNW
jgi:cell division protein FtsB